jgi:dephospho-CoA kinase
MFRLGLTGSIGMGKSTTAGLFADEGVPVIDADRIVHDLYQADAVPLIAEIFPETISEGKVDRTKLSALLAAKPEAFPKLEAVIHPLVRRKQEERLETARLAGHDIVVFDIPLLYETGGETRMNGVAVVSCDPELQKQRVLERPGMTADKFAMILARQLPDAEKRRRADFVIDTGHGLDHARAQVRDIISCLRQRQKGN